MAGGFAHMTLVDTLCNGRALGGIPNVTAPMKEALEFYRNFAELGAVSPDYPTDPAHPAEFSLIPVESAK